MLRGRVPKPVIEAGKGEKCVESTEFMRRNHMELLKHQRDETMHNGIRTRSYSLKGCIECHASRKTNSVIGTDQNFCQSCHSYAAVKLDCFECHASKPKATARPPRQRWSATGVDRERRRNERVRAILRINRHGQPPAVSRLGRGGGRRHRRSRPA